VTGPWPATERSPKTAAVIYGNSVTKPIPKMAFFFQSA